MNNSFLEKWLTCIDNQFTDNSEYATYNDIFVSSQKNHNYYLNKLINYIINNNIIDKDSDITLLISTLVLLKKLRKKYIFPKNMIYKIILGLFIISEKINNDHLYDNYTWAKINNLSIKEINNIELTLLYYLEFNIFINRTEFLNISQILYN